MRRWRKNARHGSLSANRILQIGPTIELCQRITVSEGDLGIVEHFLFENMVLCFAIFLAFISKECHKSLDRTQRLLLFHMMIFVPL